MPDSAAMHGPRSLGDVIDGAFRIFRAHFVPLVLTAAALLIPMGILSGVLTGRYVMGMQSMLTAAEAMDSATPDAALGGLLVNLVSTLGLMLIMIVLVLVFNGLASLALSAHVLAILHQQSLSFTQGLRRALGRFGTYVGMSLVRIAAIGGITLGIAVVAMLFLVFVGLGAGLVSGLVGDSPIAGLTLAGAVLFGLCTYLIFVVMLMVPYLYLSARWVAAVPGLVDQKLGPVQALRNSWHLTRRTVWRTVLFLFLMGLLSLIVTTFPVLVLQQLLLALLPFDPLIIATIASAVGSLASVLWQPINAAALVLYYVDLRVRQEGYDLALRIQQVEADVLPDQVQP